MKELKKRLKRNKRPMWSLGLIAALFLGAVALGAAAASYLVKAGAALDSSAAWVPANASDKPYEDVATRDRTLAALARWSGEVELVLHRVYLCGEENRMLGRQTTSDARERILSHLEWDAKFDRIGTVVMEERVDDLSSECRSNAYIGIDEEGNLSLFDGPPQKDNVMRTFFQLDVRTLESSLSKERLNELVSGIKVSDKDEYNSVLSAFSDYASEKSEGALKRE